MKVSKKIALVAVALVLCLASGLFARNVQTTNKATVIKIDTVPTRHGVMSAQHYKRVASGPYVIIVGDNFANRESADAIAVELSRRSVNVIVLDTYGYGLSKLNAPVNKKTFETYKSIDVGAAKETGAKEILTDFYDTAIDGNGEAKLDAIKALGVYDLIVDRNNATSSTRISILGIGSGGDIANQVIALDNAYAIENGVAPRIGSIMLAGAKPVLDGENVEIASVTYTKSYYGERNVGVISGSADDRMRDGKISAGKYASSDNAKGFIGEMAELKQGGESTVIGDKVVTADRRKLKKDEYDESKEWKTHFEYRDGVYTGSVSNILGTAAAVSSRSVFVTGASSIGYYHSPKSLEAMVNFLGITASGINANTMAGLIRSANSQVWWIKEIINIVGFISLLIFLVPFVSLLLQIKWFAPIKAKRYAGQTVTNGGKGGLMYWLTFGIYIVLSGLIFGGLMNILSRGAAAFFNQPLTTAFMVCLLLCAVVLCVLYIVGRVIRKGEDEPEEYSEVKVVEEEVLVQEAGDNIAAESIVVTKTTVASEDPATEAAARPQAKGIRGLLDRWGVTIRPMDLLKTFIVALAGSALFFAVIYLINYLFKANFKFLDLAFEPFNGTSLIAFFKYFIPFAVFFAVSSLVINAVVARKNNPEWLNMLLIACFSAGGVFLLLLLRWIGAFSFKMVNPYAMLTICVLLVLSGLLARYCFKKTGKIWLGTMLNTMIVTMLICASAMTILV